MMKMKRILSLVLALVMLVGMFTMVASASETDNAPATTKTGTIHVKVTYQGQPLQGAVVYAYDSTGTTPNRIESPYGTTDSSGNTTFTASFTNDYISVACAHGTTGGIAEYRSGVNVVGAKLDDTLVKIGGTSFETWWECELDSNYKDWVVNFVVDGELYSDCHVKNGETVTEPVDPKKSGSVFNGWVTDSGAAWNFTTPVTNHMNLRATWTAAPETVPSTPVIPTSIYGTYKGAVKVSCAAGHHDTKSYDFTISSASQVTMQSATKAVVYLTETDRSAYLAWYNTDTSSKHSDVTKQAIALVLEYREGFWFFPAHWEVTSVAEMEVQCDCTGNHCGSCCGSWWHKHTVTYTDGVKNEVVFKDITYTVKHGDKTPVPTNPTRAGYKFTGWTPAVADKTTACVTYTATWTPVKTPDLTSEHVAYIKGYGKGLVKPEGEITRAEAITMLYRLMDAKSAKEFYTPYNSFTDVAKDAWYNDAVSTLANAGVLRYTSGKLNPNEAITRAEFFYMLTKFTDATYSGKCTFKDVPANHWAYDELALAQNLGWIKGYGGSMLYPDDTISRAEVAASLNRVLGRTTCTVKDTKNFSDNPVNAWYYKDIVEASISH